MDLGVITAKDIKIREADDTLSDEKNANDLIPKLIFKINKYSSRLKDRVKIYSMFQEFDSYAHMNLQNFIKMQTLFICVPLVKLLVELLLKVC